MSACRGDPSLMLAATAASFVRLRFDAVDLSKRTVSLCSFFLETVALRVTLLPVPLLLGGGYLGYGSNGVKFLFLLSLSLVPLVVLDHWSG